MGVCLRHVRAAASGISDTLTILEPDDDIRAATVRGQNHGDEHEDRARVNLGAHQTQPSDAAVRVVLDSEAPHQVGMESEEVFPNATERQTATLSRR